MFAPPVIRDWARRLIASEVDVDPPYAQMGPATRRVYERLRWRLCATVGAGGFQALASRGLYLAKSLSLRLNAVQVEADGGLSGLDELGLQMGPDEDADGGIILIAQLVRLFLTLLGEAAAVRLIEGVPFQVEVKAKSDTAGLSNAATGTNYFGPFEGILLEADQLRNVSKRLETLADKHAGIDELMSVVGNIRNIAAVLDAFTFIRSKGDAPQDDQLSPPTNGYVN